jgi:hypothetical protein
MADEIGIECMAPIAHWKGYGGESNPNGPSFESIAWRAGCWRRPGAYYQLHSVEGSPRPFGCGPVDDERSSRDSRQPVSTAWPSTPLTI